MILKKSLTYIISDVLNKILPFLMLPIITRYLLPSDYGTLSVFTSIIGFLAVFVGLGSQEMVRVNYFLVSKEELKIYIGHVFTITVISSIAYLLIFILTGDIIFQKYGLSLFWTFLAVLITFLEFFKKIISTIWIAEGNSLAFAKYSNFTSLTVVLTTILFVVLLEWNWQGRVYSLLTSAIIFAGLGIYFLRKKGYLAIKYDINGLRNCISESIGVLPYSVSFWFKNAALLLIMAYYIGKEATGLYASAMQIAIIVNFIAVAINKVWQPFVFRMMSVKTTVNNIKIVKSFYVYLLLIVISGIAIIVFSTLIVKIILGPAYQSASLYVRYLTIAVTLQSLFTALADFLIFHKDNRNLTLVSVSGIILQYMIICMFFFFYELSVLNIIFSAIIAGVYTLIIGFWKVRRVRTLPWFFFLNPKAE